MKGSNCSLSAEVAHESLFDQCAWLYALYREYLFRDHTDEIVGSLFPVEGPLSGTNVLEIGCGSGFYTRRLAQRFPAIRTTGIDMSTRLLERAKERAANLRIQNCNFRVGDAQSLPELNTPMDAVICSRLLLIVPDRKAVLAEIFRILRPGGRCFLAEPTSEFRAHIPLLGMRLAAGIIGRSARLDRRPRKAGVLGHNAFSDLIHTQPWSTINIQSSSGYQYAVCQKPSTEDTTLGDACERLTEHKFKGRSVA